MLHNQPNYDTRAIFFQLLFGVVLLFGGCCIYLLFRSKTLRIYQWCSEMGVSDIIDVYRGHMHDWHIPDVVKYSFPDGLYNAAYILIMEAIWSNVKSSYKYVIILLVPFFTIISELLQYYGIIKGTFDVYDLACYSAPVFICIIFWINNINNLKINKI